MMDESPIQGNSQSALSVQCALKENSSNIQWQDFSDKVSSTQNSKLLLLTVSHRLFNNMYLVSTFFYLKY